MLHRLRDHWALSRTSAAYVGAPLRYDRGLLHSNAHPPAQQRMSTVPSLDGCTGSNCSDVCIRASLLTCSDVCIRASLLTCRPAHSIGTLW
jgi:hypothetical protein